MSIHAIFYQNMFKKLQKNPKRNSGLRFNSNYVNFRVLWAIHSGKRPPPILDCPEVLESLMNRCWNKDASVRPTMGEIVETMNFVKEFFPPTDNQPLIFPEDQENESETCSSCYESAKENVEKSEVLKTVDESDHANPMTPKKSSVSVFC